MDQLAIVFIGLIFLMGLFVPFLRPLLKNYTGRILALVPFALFGILTYIFFSLPDETVHIIDSGFGFLPEMSFTFRIDGLSLIFGMMVSGIGGLVLGYSSFYMAKYASRTKFYFFLVLFMGAMLGIVFADNLLALFIFWELTSITSFFLIGFDHHLEKSRQAALQALLLTSLGGLCLLFATIMIGSMAGTYSLSELYSNGIHFGAHSNYHLVFALIFVAIATKSAQFPFHFWLPGAMNAPTPISAYLHSATMVNAGIFLLLRLNPILGGTILCKTTLILTGGITMFIGAFFSLGQKDLKRILAFTTISALGTMVMLIGMNTNASIKAALVFFIVHGLYKGGLFMMAGIIDKNTGTRDIKKLSGLLRSMPVTGIAGILALLSMMGLPPMLGFIGKELIYDANIQMPELAWLIVPLGVAANMLMVAISILVFYEIFLPHKNKPAIALMHPERELPRNFIAGPVVLAIFGMGLGIFPRWLEKTMSNAIFFIQSQTVEIHLTLWHGFNKVLLISIFTVLMGTIIFLLRKPVGKLVTIIIKWTDQYHLPERFNTLIKKYLSFAGKHTNRIQHGYHRYYLITFFAATFILVMYQLISLKGNWFPSVESSQIQMHVVIILVVSALAVIFTVFSRSRLSAILSMGVVGYGIGVLYMFYGAVDLAITQFLVETILMVIFVMVIYHLPRFTLLSTKKSRIRDALIAAGVGIMMTSVVLKARFINLEPPISDFFAENSFLKGYGRNIVNVILVDFRALDTLGEITVLALAAAGVFSLLRLDMNNKKPNK
jgi:multicomponent Na+:H+ antiporter subunit A